MINLYILNFKVLTLFLGFASSLIALIYYFQFKKPSAKYFSGFLFGLFLLHIGALISYLSIHIPDLDKLKGYDLTVAIITPCYFFITFYGLKFTLSLFKKKLNSNVQVIIVIYYIIQNVLNIKGFGYAKHPYDIIPGFIAGLFMIFYIILNFKNIVDEFLKKSIKFFIIISSLFIPLLSLFFIEKFYNFISILTFIYFFLIGVGSILFAFKFFTREPYLTDNRPTNHFKRKYQISDREMDVIGLLLKGKTAKDIGEELNISTRTVTTHTSNIYKKTNVTSKIQLINLFGSNWSK